MVDADRREFSRVDAFISLHTRVVQEGKHCNLISHVSSEPSLYHFGTLPDVGNEALSECIRIMNAKLDAILKMLMFHDKEAYSLETNNVNISGSGLSFDSQEPYPLGTLLEIRMVFPEMPESMLHVYGEVVKLEMDQEDVFRISIRYTIIDEEIRDKIVKYVFDKQREMIRKSRRQ